MNGATHSFAEPDAHHGHVVGAEMMKRRRDEQLAEVLTHQGDVVVLANFLEEEVDDFLAPEAVPNAVACHDDEPIVGRIDINGFDFRNARDDVFFRWFVCTLEHVVPEGACHRQKTIHSAPGDCSACGGNPLLFGLDCRLVIFGKIDRRKISTKNRAAVPYVRADNLSFCDDDAVRRAATELPTT